MELKRLPVAEADACACCAGGGEGEAEAGEFDGRRNLLLIGAAGVLWAAGFAFREPLAATPYAAAEVAVFGSAYLLSGWNVLRAAARNILGGRVFDENFLMTVATLGALAIGEMPEAVAVMVFYKVGEYFQGLSVSRSRRSIRALLAIRPEAANLIEGGGTRTVAPEAVGVGARILVRPGERVPLDGEVEGGASQVDTSALTGEPVPRRMRAGDAILAGMINQTGALTVRVTRTSGESSIARILDLVENAAGKKAVTEQFITRFARVYTPIVVAAALGVAFLPPLVLAGASFNEWIYRALVLLVISCPCALVVSIPMGYFGGVGGASRSGILVKGSNFLDALAAVRTVVFDKTGTLTRGEFRVTDAVPCDGLSREELLRLAARAESHSNHPIAQSIREAGGGAGDPGEPSVRGDPGAAAEAEAEGFEEISGVGVRARVDGRRVLVGNDRFMHMEDIPHDVCRVDEAATMVHLAEEGKYAGYIVISDALKEGAAEAVRELKALGVERVVMLTGDNRAAAESVARRVGVDAWEAELLPGEKVEALERIMAERRGRGTVAFVGDGINDAPVIVRADVGVAVGDLGSDAAIDVADVVLMGDSPSKMARAIAIGKRTRRIVWENIALALGVKGVFILAGLAGLASMWGAVFADMGVALMAVFNATRALR